MESGHEIPLKIHDLPRIEVYRCRYGHLTTGGSRKLTRRCWECKKAGRQVPMVNVDFLWKTYQKKNK